MRSFAKTQLKWLWRKQRKRRPRAGATSRQQASDHRPSRAACLPISKTLSTAADCNLEHLSGATISWPRYKFGGQLTGSAEAAHWRSWQTSVLMTSQRLVSREEAGWLQLHLAAQQRVGGCEKISFAAAAAAADALLATRERDTWRL